MLAGSTVNKLCVCRQQGAGDLEAWLHSLHCQPGLVQCCWQAHTSSTQQQSSEQEAPAEHSTATGNARYLLPASLEAWHEAWGLPDSSLVPAWGAGAGSASLSGCTAAGWRDYYNLRGLSDKSPAGRL